MNVQALLKEVEAHGIHLELSSEDKIRYRAQKPVPPRLIERLKAEKPRLLELLKKRYPDSPGKYLSRGQAEKSHSLGSGKVFCEGYDQYLHVDVCKWHIEQGDLKCAHCNKLSSKEIGFWCDAYLTKVINWLNSFYKPGYRIAWETPGLREQVDKLEKEITQCASKLDIDGFIEAVNKWGKLFSNHRVQNCQIALKDTKQGEKNEQKATTNQDANS